MAIEPWRILERIQGYVDTREAGQDEWVPIFRSRRLNDGAMIRVHKFAVARLNMADCTSYTFFAIQKTLVLSVSNYQLSVDGRRIVSDLRDARLKREIWRFLGGQARFDIDEDMQRHGQNSGAARG